MPLIREWLAGDMSKGELIFALCLFIAFIVLVVWAPKPNNDSELGSCPECGGPLNNDLSADFLRCERCRTWSKSLQE